MGCTLLLCWLIGCPVELKIKVTSEGVTENGTLVWIPCGECALNSGDRQGVAVGQFGDQGLGRWCDGGSVVATGDSDRELGFLAAAATLKSIFADSIERMSLISLSISV